MKSFVLLLLALFVAGCSQPAQPVAAPEKTPMPRNADADAFITRMKEPGPANLMQAAIKGLTTDFSNRDNADAVLKQSMTFVGALSRYENGDPASLNEYGGVGPFKEKCAAWLKHDEQSVRAFAAVMLGMSGDKAYTPQLSELLKRTDYAARDTVKYDRGRAAIALGMIGAEDVKKQLGVMLSSSEYNDRQGASLGLGFLKAKEFAPQIAKLQTDKEPNVRYDAKAALKLMGAEDLITK